jgi:hypothetical protein
MPCGYDVRIPPSPPEEKRLRTGRVVLPTLERWKDNVVCRPGPAGYFSDIWIYRYIISLEQLAPLVYCNYHGVDRVFEPGKTSLGNDVGDFGDTCWVSAELGDKGRRTILAYLIDQRSVSEWPVSPVGKE